METYLFQAVSAIIILTLHAFARGAVSAALGDRLPKERGRLTLNPLKQLDLFGFIAMTLFGFGWGNPVETSSLNYKNRRRDSLITAVAPTAAVLILGFAAGLAYKLSRTFIDPASLAAMPLVFFFYTTASLSFSFVILNLIPIPPMDGARVLTLFMPPTKVWSFRSNEKIFQIIFLFLIFLGLIGRLIRPVVALIMLIF